MAEQTPALRPGAVLAPRAGQTLWQAPDWQRLWLSTQLEQRAWSSLVLVPAGDGAPASFTLQVAVALSHTGMSHLRGDVYVADATHIELDELMLFRQELQSMTRQPDRVLIALPPLMSCVTAQPLAQMADAALVCVLKGVTRTRDVKRTVAMLGKTKVLGAALFHPQP
jgi:hypothetical protein